MATSTIQQALDAAYNLTNDLRTLRDYTERGNSELLHILLVNAACEVSKVQSLLGQYARENGMTQVTVIEGRKAGA